MNTSPRIGFCCKYETSDPTQFREMNQKSTTLTSLKKLSLAEATNKLLGIVDFNIKTLRKQLEWIATQPLEMRMFRISSDFLPAFTAPDFSAIYQTTDMKDLIENGLSWVRPYTKANGIRLGTHPGQFTTLCSQNPTVVLNSITDLNYQAWLAECMGYGDTWHSDGYYINIHANSRLDPNLDQLKDAIRNKLSPTLRNLLTIENDEFCCSVDDFVSTQLYKDVALVLDIHHHWVQSRGEYIQPNDPRIEFFKESWKDQRPLGHYSTSSETLLIGTSSVNSLDYQVLESSGHKPSKLRAHSYDCWNQANNDWALSHLTWTDLEVEAKGKQIASKSLYDRGKVIGLF